MHFSDKQKGIRKALVEKGHGARHISEQYVWARSSVQDIISRYKKSKSTESKSSNSGRKRVAEEKNRWSSRSGCN